MREPGPGGELAGRHAASGSRSDTRSRSAIGPHSTRREVQQAYRKAHRHPWLRRGSIALAGGLVGLLVMGAMVYVKLNDNINGLDVSKLVGRRPAHVVDPVSNLAPG